MTMLKRYAALLTAAILLMPALAASAASEPKAPKAEKAHKAKKANAKKAIVRNTVKFVPGSQETVGQRNARLKRECKGGVNAGACTGYTH